jgi:hypothetical protein
MFKPATAKDLYDITAASAQAKSGQVFIYEKGSMGDLFHPHQAEAVRALFLKNNITVKQITNNPILPKFSENDDFINQVMQFRYVPPSVYTIEDEIVIFDDIVAIYNTSRIAVIHDSTFAQHQKQLFLLTWDQGQSPKLEFEYKPNHSFYNNLTYKIGSAQIIVWPDADADQSFGQMSKEEIGIYIQDVIKTEKEWDKTSYFIVFLWAYNGERMMDIWSFTNNHVDDRSGPLSQVRIYREGMRCEDLGMASGNTLLVLGHEEKMRRQSKSIQDYLDGPTPKFPLEIMNGKDFFEKNDQ